MENSIIKLLATNNKKNHQKITINFNKISEYKHEIFATETHFL